MILVESFSVNLNHNKILVEGILHITGHPN